MLQTVSNLKGAALAQRPHTLGSVAPAAGSRGRISGIAYSAAENSEKELAAVHSELRTLTAAFLAVTGGKGALSDLIRRDSVASRPGAPVADASAPSNDRDTQISLPADEEASMPHTPRSPSAGQTPESSHVPASKGRGKNAAAVTFSSRATTRILTDSNNCCPEINADATSAASSALNGVESAVSVPSSARNRRKISGKKGYDCESALWSSRILWVEALRLTHAASTAASSAAAAVAEAVAAVSGDSRPTELDDNFDKSNEGCGDEVGKTIESSLLEGDNDGTATAISSGQTQLVVQTLQSRQRCSVS